jgi:hypothetical protein
MGKKTIITFVVTILVLLGLIALALSPAHSTPYNGGASVSTSTDSYSRPESTYPPTRPEEVEGGGYLGNPYDSNGKLRTPDRCVRDTKICTNGKSVTRDPKLYCQFSPCGE